MYEYHWVTYDENDKILKGWPGNKALNDHSSDQWSTTKTIINKFNSILFI